MGFPPWKGGMTPTLPIPPLQGGFDGMLSTQGVALGYLIRPRWGRKIIRSCWDPNLIRP